MSSFWAFAVFSLFFVPGSLMIAAGKRLDKRRGSQPAPSGGKAHQLRITGTTLMLIGAILYVALLVRPTYGLVIVISLILWAIICTLPPLRRIRVASQTTFRCTPAQAFELLADPTREPQYRSEVESSEIVSGGRPAVGTVIRQTVRIPPSDHSPGVYTVGEERITEYDWPHTFATEVIGRNSLSRTVFEATAEGTRVTTASELVMDFRTALWGAIFFRGYLAGQIKQSRQKGWERARDLLEHAAA